jgi:diguanylate cyclase (GGDEF)-like protein
VADGEPVAGDPEPAPFPPTLPGFHRREAWRVLDHELVAEGERRARLRLWCDPRRLEPGAEAALAALLPQMAAAVRAAFLDREASTDRLTGAGTRRALERRLARGFERARDEGEALAVVICDLDHFKKINDRYGHPVGDDALRAVARVLLAANRGGEFCARFGGEEFVLVFEQTTGEIALEIAERLRRRIEEIELDTDLGRHALTMSFGVAAFPELAVRGPEELVELADGALYTAKRLGRNLCVLDTGGGRMRTGSGDEIEVTEAPPVRTPVFFA